MTSGTEHSYTRTEYHLWEEKQDGKGKKFRGKNKRTRRRKREMMGGGGGGGGGGGSVQGILCFADKLILVQVFGVLFCV